MCENNADRFNAVIKLRSTKPINYYLMPVRSSLPSLITTCVMDRKRERERVKERKERPASLDRREKYKRIMLLAMIPKDFVRHVERLRTILIL